MPNEPALDQFVNLVSLVNFVRILLFQQGKLMPHAGSHKAHQGHQVHKVADHHTA